MSSTTVKPIRFTRSGSTYNFFIEGKCYPVKPDHCNYNEICGAVMQKLWEKIPALLSVEEKIESYFKGKKQQLDINVSKGQVIIDGKAIPAGIAATIIDFVRQKKPYTPIVLFWRNLAKNPDPNCRERLFAFLGKTGHPITDDGCFLAYKKVRDDMKDHHSGSVHYGIGKTVKKKREDCDPNPRNTCSSGLHVANYNYAWGFGSNSKMIECKISPEHVVAIPDDYSWEKMRVCELLVLGLNKTGVRQDIYVSTKKKSKKKKKPVNQKKKAKIKPKTKPKQKIKPKSKVKPKNKKKLIKNKKLQKRVDKRRMWYKLVGRELRRIRSTKQPEGYSAIKPAGYR